MRMRVGAEIDELSATASTDGLRTLSGAAAHARMAGANLTDDPAHRRVIYAHQQRNPPETGASSPVRVCVCACVWWSGLTGLSVGGRLSGPAAPFTTCAALPHCVWAMVWAGRTLSANIVVAQGAARGHIAAREERRGWQRVEIMGAEGSEN